jgi:hypothetical protein
MVKQSRRQVKKRSLRRRTAKKRVMKRRAVKGGAYTEPTTDGVPAIFMRRALGSNLYKLTSIKQGDTIRHELDFSAYNGGRFTDLFISAGKYIDILIEGLAVTQDVDKANIKSLITKLFEGGIEKVKQRKLIITEPLIGNGSATIEITDSNNPITNGKVIIQTPRQRFFNFLKTKKDEIMPAQAQ